MMIVRLYLVYFFFSSRRRHTRWPRDWSSDVCSSDLRLGEGFAVDPDLSVLWSKLLGNLLIDFRTGRCCHTLARPARFPLRSEERRVGKEGRSRGGTSYVKKKRENDENTSV